MTVAVFLLLAALAAANGGNDVSKGVATLAGAGVTRYRTAVLWGTVTTLAGALASLAIAGAMTKLFSSGIVSADPTSAFALAVLVGAASWVLLATIARLPVSTTHALVGALIGAGLLLAPGSVEFGALLTSVAMPLLLSVFVAFGISWLLSLLPLRVPECICITSAETAPAGVAAGSDGTMAFQAPSATLPVQVRTGTSEQCRVHGRGLRVGRVINGLHWLSSGATSFARGLNDTPKIVAVGAFTLVPAGMSNNQVLFVVAGAMALGAITVGLRVAARLGEGVVQLTDVSGFTANLTTSVLVGLGAANGLPMSTTHVSTGAVAGAAGRKIGTMNMKTIRDFVIAWVVTPPFAGLVAAGVYLIAR